MRNGTLLHVINSLSIGGAEVLLVNTIKLLPDYQHVLVNTSRRFVGYAEGGYHPYN